MTWKKLTFGVDDVWLECTKNHIDPEGDPPKIWCWIADDDHLKICDSEDPAAGSPDRSFVLFSPKLFNKVIQRTLTVRRKNHIPSGFLVKDANQYQNVFVIGEFSDAELAPLVQANIVVQRVPGATPKEISDNLEALL